MKRNTFLQTNGEAEITNSALKRILKISIGSNRNKWSNKLDNTLWAFRTIFKGTIGTTPIRLVYSNSCHFPI